MDASVVYADLTLARTGKPMHVSPPCLPPDTFRCPRWHRLALKLGCVGLTILILSVIGLSVLVLSRLQKTSVEKCIVDFQKINRTKTTDSPAEVECPKDWLPHRDKCIHFSQESNIWKKGLVDCATKGATLLLVQDKEDLTFIKDSRIKKANSFWIGLNYTWPDRKWKWINGSTLNSDVFQITGEAENNSCATISQGRVISEYCDSDNKWICQKERVSETCVRSAD